MAAKADHPPIPVAAPSREAPSFVMCDTGLVHVSLHVRQQGQDKSDWINVDAAKDPPDPSGCPLLRLRLLRLLCSSLCKYERSSSVSQRNKIDLLPTPTTTPNYWTSRLEPKHCTTLSTRRDVLCVLCGHVAWVDCLRNLSVNPKLLFVIFFFCFSLSCIQDKDETRRYIFKTLFCQFGGSTSIIYPSGGQTFRLVGHSGF